MRCKNCGWDNPIGKTKCEKCNTQITGSVVDKNSIQKHATPEVHPPQKTSRGCPYKDCGYPLKPTDTECPNCGRSVLDVENPPNLPKSSPPTVMKEGDGEGRKLVAFLVTYSHLPDGSFFPLYQGRNTLGRDESNDIVIPDEKVSKKHLEIAYYNQNKTFQFETVGLTQNGTYINDTFFPRGGGELQSSDVITIGSTKLTFIPIPEIAFD